MGQTADLVISEHDQLGGLSDDDHPNNFYLPGRAGGQNLIAGINPSEEVVIRGTSAANLGLIRFQSPVVFDSAAAAFALSPYAFAYAAVENYTAGFIGGGMDMSPTITFSASTFIWEAYRGGPDITSGVTPAFAAFTILQALPTLRAGAAAGQNPLNPLIINAGAAVVNSFTGTKTNATNVGLNFAPSARALVSGAAMNVTNMSAMIVAPKYGTVAGGSISFGTVRGVWCQNPALGLFQPGAGVEAMTAYYGVDVQAIPFGGNVAKAAVRSAIAAASNAYFLQNIGGAESNFGDGIIRLNDATQIIFGDSADAGISWAAAGYLRMLFVNSLDDLQFSTPVAGRFLIQGNDGIVDGGSEVNFAFHKFSLGAQTGAVGNQVGIFAAGARSTEVGGEWTDFLLTQAANLTVDHAMGLVAAWTINVPSMTLGTGTVTTAGGLNIGGNPNQGSINRFGIRVLSNPSGGSGINAALWITAGLTRLDGLVEIANDLTFEGESTGLQFGELYVENNAVATAIAVINTWVQVTVFTNNGQANGATPDNTQDHITIAHAGKYLITVSASVLSGVGAGGVYECEIRTNNGGTSFPNIHWDRQLSGGGGDVGSTSMSGIADLAASDTVELWVRNKTTTTDITFEDCNLTIVEIGGT